MRADTPATEYINHLNNCGSSLPPTPVLEAAVNYLKAEASMGGYEAWGAHQPELNAIYSATARYLNCAESEVAFTASASDGWWRAFLSIPLQPGDRVLIGRSEFQANAYGLMQARERGIVVDVVPNDQHGNIDLEELDKMADGAVKLVCLTHISMANGAVQDAAAVGAAAKRLGAFFLLDSCQVAGQRPLDVQELGCDFLNYTGRKFMRGMRGTGILYARSGAIGRLGQTPFLDGRSATWTGPDSYEYAAGAHRFEFGEQNFAGKVALGVATNYALELGFERIQDRIGMLSARLRDSLAAIPSITICDEGTDQSGIVTFTSSAMKPETIQQNLSTRSINVGAPGKSNAQLDLGLRGLDNVVRAGVHYFNTEDELDQLADAVQQIVRA